MNERNDDDAENNNNVPVVSVWDIFGRDTHTPVA